MICPKNVGLEHIGPKAHFKALLPRASLDKLYNIRWADRKSLQEDNGIAIRLESSSAIVECDERTGLACGSECRGRIGGKG